MLDKPMKITTAFLIILLFSIFNPIKAEIITEREQAIFDAEKDVNSKIIQNFSYGFCLGSGTFILPAMTFILEDTFLRNNGKDLNIFSNPFPFGSLTIGCFTGFSVFSVVYSLKATVPAERLLGKSPKYVETYTKTYKSYTKASKRIAIAGGCLSGLYIVRQIGAAYFGSTED